LFFLAFAVNFYSGLSGLEKAEVKIKSMQKYRDSLPARTAERDE
jgi:hypothetical protein